MEQHTSFYTNTPKPMSTCYYNPPSLGQNQEIFFNESSNDSQNRNQSRDVTPKASSMPTFSVGNDEDEDDIEDEESEFKMGRLIRQASLNSSHMAAPQQITNYKVMTGSSSLPARCSSQKHEANQEKINNMRRFESMKERSRSKNSMKMSGGPPTIPGGLAAKGSSEDMKAQIKFWARAVAFNVHQEC